jgi:orotate phosphoribosyltransferase
VIEDLVSTGKSSLQVVSVLQLAGLEVLGMASIFNYRFEAGKRAFEAAGVELHSLTDYPSLLQVGISKGLLEAGQAEVLLNWRNDPANWRGVH